MFQPMRIHIYSRAFAPAVGGMERLMETLASEFHRLGHKVVVVSETPGSVQLPYSVVRRPGFLAYRKLASQSDVILSAPLSLRRLLGQLLSGRRICVAHPLPFARSGRHGLSGRLKQIVCRLTVNIVPSRFLAQHLPDPVVIPNPFEGSLFTLPPSEGERAGVVFAGRQVPEKGCQLLLEAFAAAAPSARLTIIGDGPERGALQACAARLGILERVEFCGVLSGKALAAKIGAHRVMVVPSLWEEPFGIVALEGLACGCRVIVANSGGLPEAVGALALTFPRGDRDALTRCLDQALGPDDCPPSGTDVAAHLAGFTPTRIAAQYLEVLHAAALPR